MTLLWEKLIHFAYFAGQTAVILLALIVLASFIFSQVQKNKDRLDLQITDLNERFAKLSFALTSTWMNKQELKQYAKNEKKEKAEHEKTRRAHIFVLDFKGDIKASAVHSLREEISAVIGAAKPGDEVVVKVESPGGVVHGYGLAASQLMRIRRSGLKLTVCVDKVAASGGYMMACVADQILAAPFAILGSIGVLAQVPNFNRLLKKHDIDFQEITAGEYKRTLSLFGEVTEKGKEKFTQQIADTHQLFKTFVQQSRPQIDIAKVSTGEYWFATQAIEFKLADQIMTSDEYLMAQSKDKALVEVRFEEKKKLMDKLLHSAQLAGGKLWSGWWDKAREESAQPL